MQYLGKTDYRVERCAKFVAHVGQEVRFREVCFFSNRPGALQLDIFFVEYLIQAFTFGNIACSGKHALQLSIPIIKGGRIDGNDRFLTIPGACREFVVGDLFFAQHQFNTGLSPFRISEIVFKRRADQFITRTVGKHLHLFVNIGDNAVWIGSHNSVDVGFKQGAGVELMISQALTKLHLLGLYLLTRSVVGTDKQITDDDVLCITQRRNRHDRREAAAILTNVGKLVYILDTTRSLEY